MGFGKPVYPDKHPRDGGGGTTCMGVKTNGETNT